MFFDDVHVTAIQFSCQQEQSHTNSVPHQFDFSSCLPGTREDIFSVCDMLTACRRNRIDKSLIIFVLGLG